MDEQRMDREEYKEERKFLAHLEAEAYKGFDTALLTLSSGAIALSVTFIEKFGSASCVGLLMSAWILWAASLLCQLCSYIFTSKAMREEQKILTEQYVENAKDARTNPYFGSPTRFNTAALIFFMLGVVFFLFFVANRIY